MYRARATAVSGTKVLAGGKWLTCIGNKNVRAGDLIWTDGRCVYGNKQTPQQPIVITGKEDWGIPIVISRRYLTYIKNLKEHTDIDSDTAAIQILPQMTLLTNNKKGTVYFSTNRNILATNVDNFGNVYTIEQDGKQKIRNYFGSDAMYFEEEGDRELVIKKNGAVVKSVTPNFQEETRKAAEKLYSQEYAKADLVPHGGTLVEYWYSIKQVKGIPLDLLFDWETIFNEGYFSYSSRTETLTISQEPTRYPSMGYEWAFIENENNWGVIVDCMYTIDCNVPKVTRLSDPIMLWHKGWFGPDEFRIGGTEYYTLCTVVRRLYFVGSNETKLLFDSSRAMIESGHYYEEDYEENGWATLYRSVIGLPARNLSHTKIRHETPLIYNTENLVGATFQMQDSFYFVVNSVTPKEEDVENYAYSQYGHYTDTPKINFSVYTSSGQKLFEGATNDLPYITACKINNSKFLVAVENPYTSQVFRNTMGIYLNAIGNLYEIDDGVSKLISSGRIKNQCLRPMKHYKHWWENIQILD